MFEIGRQGIKVNNKYGGTSTIVCGFCFLIFGFYNLFIGFFHYPYNGFMVWWIGFNLLAAWIFILLIKRVINKMDSKINNIESSTKKKSVLRRYVERLRKENPYREEISFKMELIRKSFHLMGLLLVIGYFGFFILPPLIQLISDSVVIL
ncbi:MAG: hypothetical protein ACFFB9_11670, partial [Promethearchaeota archaeon]